MLLPKRAVAMMLKFEPILAKDLTETELPNCTKCTTDKAEPSLAYERIDTLDPKAT
jgi:hypothetical protein